MSEVKEKLWNANYIKVMAANFSIYCSFYLIMPLLPLYLSDDFGASKDTIGLVLSGYTLTALLIRPLSGYLVDSFDRKKVLIICLSFYFILFGGYLLASSLILFGIVRTLHGGPYGATTVANNTVAIDVLPSSRRDEGIGLYGISNNIGTAIAPMIGLYLYQTFHNFDLLFCVALVMALIALIIDSTVHVPQKNIVPNKKPLSLDRFFLTRAWLASVNVAIFGICFGVLSSYLAIYGRDVLNLSGGAGVFFLLFAIGLIISRLTGLKNMRNGRILRNIGEGIIISSVGYLLFIGITHPITYYLSAFIIGLGNGHLYPGFQNLMIHMAQHRERGTATSTMLTSWDIGQGIGILCGGMLAEHLGYGAAFWSAAILHLFGLAFFYLFMGKFYEKHKQI